MWYWQHRVSTIRHSNATSMPMDRITRAPFHFSQETLLSGEADLWLISSARCVLARINSFSGTAVTTWKIPPLYVLYNLWNLLYMHISYRQVHMFFLDYCIKVTSCVMIASLVYESGAKTRFCSFVNSTYLSFLCSMKICVVNRRCLTLNIAETNTVKLAQWKKKTQWTCIMKGI